MAAKSAVIRGGWSQPDVTARVLAVPPEERRRIERVVAEFLRRYKRPFVVRKGKLILSPAGPKRAGASPKPAKAKARKA